MLLKYVFYPKTARRAVTLGSDLQIDIGCFKFK